MKAIHSLIFLLLGLLLNAWAQTPAYQTISNSAPGFGERVDLNGDYMIASATDKAFIYKKINGNWVQQQELSMADCAACRDTAYTNNTIDTFSYFIRRKEDIIEKTYLDFGESVGIIDGYAFVSLRYQLDSAYNRFQKYDPIDPWEQTNRWEDYWNVTSSLLMVYEETASGWIPVQNSGLPDAKVFDTEGNTLLLGTFEYSEVFIFGDVGESFNMKLHIGEQSGSTWTATQVGSYGEFAGSDDPMLRISDVTFRGDLSEDKDLILTSNGEGYKKDASGSWSRFRDLTYNYEEKDKRDFDVSINGSFALFGDALPPFPIYPYNNIYKNTPAEWIETGTYIPFLSNSLEGNRALIQKIDESTGYTSVDYLDLASGDIILQSSLEAPESPGTAMFGTALDDDGNFVAISSPGINKLYVFEETALTEAPKLPITASKLLPADIGPDKFFGRVLSADGNRVLFGEKEVAGEFVQASVYSKNPYGELRRVRVLRASKRSPGSSFPLGVSLKSNQALIGAQFVDGTGKAFLFEDAYHDGSWREVAELSSPSLAGGARFGSATAIDGDIAVVGAVGSGAAYVFEKKPISTWPFYNWEEVAVLRPSDLVANSFFGSALSLSGNKVAVGAILQGQGGVVYIFERQATGSWVQTAKIEANDKGTDDRFGSPVVINGDELLVGAPLHSGTTFAGGAAYFFKRQSNGSWLQTAKLESSELASIDLFGVSADFEGDFAVIGANLQDEGAQNSGAAYIFQRQPDESWEEIIKVKDEFPAVEDKLGIAAGISNNTAYVSIESDDDGGIDGGSVIVVNPVYDPRPELSAVYETQFLPDITWDAIPFTTSQLLNRTFQGTSVGLDVPAGLSAYTDTLPLFGKTYNYDLQVNFSKGLSTMSRPVSLTTPSRVRKLGFGATCAPNPGSELRWQVNNPNNYHVLYIWAQWWNPQRDTLIAPPGQSFFYTQTNAQNPATGAGLGIYGDDNITGIWWINHRNRTDSRWDFPSSAQCTPRMADASGKQSSYFPESIDLRIPIEEIAAVEGFIKAYPNPSTGIIHVESKIPSTLRVFNMTGQLLIDRSGETALEEQELNLSQLPAGVYILEVSNEIQSQMIRIIKQ